MKSNLVLFIVLIFCSTILSSCLLRTIPSSEYSPLIATHSKKTKNTIIKEFREKYEQQCLTRDMMGICFSKIDIIENSHLIAKRRGGVTIYYSYRKEPKLLNQGSDYFIDQDQKRILYIDKQEDAYDIFGYLMRLYEIERNDTSETDNLNLTHDELISLEAETQRIDAGNETIYWQSIKDSDNPEYFKAYLEQYPTGTFAPIARIKLQEL